MHHNNFLYIKKLVKKSLHIQFFFYRKKPWTACQIGNNHYKV